MHPSRLVLTLLLAGAAHHAAAQTPPAYDSAFTDYKKYAEPQVADWKKTNADIAAKPGGHANHGKSEHDEHAGHDMAAAPADPHAAHKAKPQAAPAAPAKQIAKPKPDPHAGHQH